MGGGERGQLFLPETCAEEQLQPQLEVGQQLERQGQGGGGGGGEQRRRGGGGSRPAPGLLQPRRHLAQTCLASSGGGGVSVVSLPPGERTGLGWGGGGGSGILAKGTPAGGVGVGSSAIQAAPAGSFWLAPACPPPRPGAAQSLPAADIAPLQAPKTRAGRGEPPKEAYRQQQHHPRPPRRFAGQCEGGAGKPRRDEKEKKEGLLALCTPPPPP